LGDNLAAISKELQQPKNVTIYYDIYKKMQQVLDFTIKCPNSNKLELGHFIFD
jgi:hypothetical protein